jgi:hypothetical protein
VTGYVSVDVSRYCQFDFFNDVLNRIREADVLEMLALRLKWRGRFRTPLSDKTVRKRRLGDTVTGTYVFMRAVLIQIRCDPRTPALRWYASGRRS